MKFSRIWYLAVLSIVCVCTPAFSAEDPILEQSFKKFCTEWIETLNKYAASNMRCTQKESAYVAAYACCSKDFETTVKKAESQQSAYVGLLKYKETKYQNSAQTCEGAVQGPFTVLSECNVTQIFLYRKGRWQY